jgi:hypothetical protein
MLSAFSVILLIENKHFSQFCSAENEEYLLKKLRKSYALDYKRLEQNGIK